MSKREFKTQASSARAEVALGRFGRAGFGKTQSSVLSYVQVPPDYSAISHPNFTVALKNLSKKDATTKAKALEELETSITSPDLEIEDALLEAWVGSRTISDVRTYHDRRNLGISLSSAFDRQCSASAPARSHTQWSHVCELWQADHTPYVHASWSVAGWYIRQ